LGLEEAVREYLRMGIGTGKDGSIHEFIIGKVERALIGLILEEEKGNQVRAAKRLGINRNTLRKKMKDLRIIPRVVTR
jgi:two-component system nitrogen regulation response regulator GlnG